MQIMEIIIFIFGIYLSAQLYVDLIKPTNRYKQAKIKEKNDET